MQTYLYDDRNVTWQAIEAIGAQIYVLAIDEVCGLVDVLIRFQPNARGRVHKCAISVRSSFRGSCCSDIQMVR